MLWNKLYRTSLIKDNNIKFNEDCKYGEDFSFIIYVYSYARKIVSFNEPLYHYMIRPGSEMRAKFGEKHLSFIRFLEDRALNEERSNVKDICKIWLPISAASFIFMAVRNNSVKEHSEDIEYLKKMVVEYKDYVFNSHHVDKKYKLFLRIVLSFLKEKNKK